MPTTSNTTQDNIMHNIVIPTPLESSKHDSGWFVVLDNEGNTIDKSGDGGFSEESAAYISHAVNQYEKLMFILPMIKRALHANPNCSQAELFECCANAFEIAEKAEKAAEFTFKPSTT